MQPSNGWILAIGCRTQYSDFTAFSYSQFLRELAWKSVNLTSFRRKSASDSMPKAFAEIQTSGQQLHIAFERIIRHSSLPTGRKPQ